MECEVDEKTEAAKETTLRMIPYGLYVLGAKHGDDMAAGAINWVTQTSFSPPLIVMGVKQDSDLGEVTNALVKRDAKLLTLEECGVKYGG